MFLTDVRGQCLIYQRGIQLSNISCTNASQSNNTLRLMRESKLNTCHTYPTFFVKWLISQICQKTVIYFHLILFFFNKFHLIILNTEIQIFNNVSSKLRKSRSCAANRDSSQIHHWIVTLHIHYNTLPNVNG